MSPEGVKNLLVREACKMVVPFGKYKGLTLGEIADKEVLYLDWLIGTDWINHKKRKYLKEALELVLHDRADDIAMMLEYRDFVENCYEDDPMWDD